MSRVTLEKDGKAVVPAELCREMGLQPGDELEVEGRLIDGVPGLLLRRRNPDFSWIGSLKGHVKNQDHDLTRIDDSVAKAIAREANA